MELKGGIFLLVVVVMVMLQTTNGKERFRPYEILEIKRGATQQEVKKAYRRLVKDYHPDKNKAPDAQDKFVRLTKAYELLSDPERRRMYDNHGVTEDSPNFNKKHDYSQYNRFGDPFDHLRDLFGDNFNSFKSNGNRENIFHKQSITYKAYANTLVPNSYKQPYLILFYSDWCFSCAQVIPMWAKLVEELEPIGFGVATVHSEHERELARKVGVKELPHLVLLTDGKVTHYRESILSVVKVLEFIRRKLPYKLVQRVNDHNIDEFLDGWMDNRVRVLMFGKLDVVRLRYLTAGFKFRERAAVGYVQVTGADTKEVVDRFKVDIKKDTLLMFQEDTDTPVASLAMSDLPTNTIMEVMGRHQYLQLPRLSNQVVFDSLCPLESTRTRKRLCVVLFTRETEEMEQYRQAMRDWVISHRFSQERVRFTYILLERQHQFVSAVTKGQQDMSDPSLRVMVLWRRGADQVKLEWLQNKWDIGPTNSSSEELQNTLQRLLSANEVLSGEAVLEQLVDEHATSVFARIANRMIELSEILRDNITMDELIPAASLVLTVGVIIAGGYVMSYLVKIEEENVQKQLGARGLKVDRKGKVVPELKIHELRAETYNGMIRLLKPGCRTVVLIVDRESKEKLVAKFYKHAWPFRRNKTLMFGFMYIEKGLSWYKKILNLTLPEPRDIKINPKNCIGTVLSLNGHRRYFCMYHAKHPEATRRPGYYTASGAFMGFDSENDSSDGELDLERAAAQPAPVLDSPDHLPIFEDQLLDGLQNWMDRLFEGSTYRYHVNYWPEFPISPSTWNTK
jgi:DnaJ family protein C protein 16